MLERFVRGESVDMSERLDAAGFAVRFTPRRSAELIKAVPWLLTVGGVIAVRELVYPSWSVRSESLNEILTFVWLCAWMVGLAVFAGLLWMLAELCVSARKGIQIPQVQVDAQGLAIRKLFDFQFFAWDDMTVFYVMEFPQGDSASDYALIAFSKDQMIPDSPKMQRKVAKLKLSFPGISSGDQDKYRVLCCWLNLWRSWAIDGVNAPSLALLESILDDMRIEVLPPTP